MLLKLLHRLNSVPLRGNLVGGVIEKANGFLPESLPITIPRPHLNQTKKPDGLPVQTLLSLGDSLVHSLG